MAAAAGVAVVPAPLLLLLPDLWRFIWMGYTLCGVGVLCRRTAGEERPAVRRQRPMRRSSTHAAAASERTRTAFARCASLPSDPIAHLELLDLLYTTAALTPLRSGRPSRRLRGRGEAQYNAPPHARASVS